MKFCQSPNQSREILKNFLSQLNQNILTCNFVRVQLQSKNLAKSKHVLLATDSQPKFLPGDPFMHGGDPEARKPHRYYHPPLSMKVTGLKQEAHEIFSKSEILNRDSENFSKST